ncbi:hypothetical protein KC19_VG004900 [Ceratodon purpureus]|uniref:Uncharacterized protein n=1 Tax=Ceratodon purpureus TaxID=3225 RepID=A0A8T0HKM9_CERPU|nr:hypothetical protein KC19_VG004900 [Ceratodon purpureus]
MDTRSNYTILAYVTLTAIKAPPCYVLCRKDLYYYCRPMESHLSTKTSGILSFGSFGEIGSLILVVVVIIFHIFWNLFRKLEWRHLVFYGRFQQLSFRHIWYDTNIAGVGVVIIEFRLCEFFLSSPRPLQVKCRCSDELVVFEPKGVLEMIYFVIKCRRVYLQELLSHLF